MYPLLMRGRIRYDPDRGAMKRRTEWWCVIEFAWNSDFTRYMRWQYERHWYQYEPIRQMKLWNPAHGDHCTLIRGEKPRDQSQWGYRDGEWIDVWYNNEIHIGNQSTFRDETLFYHVNCWVPDAKDIRGRLGLPTGLPTGHYNGPDFHYHITIGKSTAT